MELGKSAQQELQNEAYQLVVDQQDPIMRGKMVATALEEGLPITLEFALNNLSEIADEDERSPERLTAYQEKNWIAQRSAIAFADQGRFEDADVLVDFLSDREPYVYLGTIYELLKKKHAGPDDAYLKMHASTLCEYATRDLDEGITEYGKIVTQQFRISQYLEAVAGYGVNIFEAENSFNAMLLQMDEMGKSVSEDPRHGQYLLQQIGKEYVVGGHTELALETKAHISDAYYRAKLSLIIAEHTDDPDLAAQQLSEIDQICMDYPYCRYNLELQFQLLTYEATRNPDGAERLADIVGEPGPYYPEVQSRLYLELYKQFGSLTARQNSLNTLTRVNFHRPELLAEQIRAVAEADLLWSNVVASNEGNKTMPQIAQELDEVFPFIDPRLAVDYQANKTGAVEVNVVKPSSEKYKRLRGLFSLAGIASRIVSDAPKPSAYHDLFTISNFNSNSLAARDRSYVQLATMELEKGSADSSQMLLDRVVGSDEKVRGLIALSQQVAEAY